MNDNKNSDSLVETIRSKTENDVLKKYLKSTLGGYTKSSVHDYLSLLREQQQASAEIFTQNQQALFDEKEKLRQENEKLKTLLTKSEAEYKNLSEAVLAAGEPGVCDANNASDGKEAYLTELKKQYAAIEEELKHVSIENSSLENKVKLQAETLKDDVLKLNEAAQEIQSLQEALRAEKLESKKARSEVARLSGMISEKDGEIDFLRQSMAESELNDLRLRINELTQQLAVQTQIVSNGNSEIVLKAKTIKTISSENESLKQNIVDLTKAIEELKSQNDCLKTANTTLTDELQNEYKQMLSLIMEKSEKTVDKLAAQRKLSEANSKITTLELRLKDLESTKSANTIHVKQNDTLEYEPF